MHCSSLTVWLKQISYKEVTGYYKESIVLASFILPPSSPFPHLFAPSSLSPGSYHPPDKSVHSISLSMPGPALSFVSCSYLHFQQPHINLSLVLPSITLSSSSLPSPSHMVRSRSTVNRFALSFWLPCSFIQDEASAWVLVCACVSVCVRCVGVWDRQRWLVGDWTGELPPHYYKCWMTCSTDDGVRAGRWLGVCGFSLCNLHTQQTSHTLSLQTERNPILCDGAFPLTGRSAAQKCVFWVLCWWTLLGNWKRYERNWG